MTCRPEPLPERPDPNQRDGAKEGKDRDLDGNFFHGWSRVEKDGRRAHARGGAATPRGDGRARDGARAQLDCGP